LEEGTKFASKSFWRGAKLTVLATPFFLFFLRSLQFTRFLENEHWNRNLIQEINRPIALYQIWFRGGSYQSVT